MVEARTLAGAEEEIRLVFGRIGALMKEEAPALFADYVIEDGADPRVEEGVNVNRSWSGDGGR